MEKIRLRLIWAKDGFTYETWSKEPSEDTQVSVSGSEIPKCLLRIYDIDPAGKLKGANFSSFWIYASFDDNGVIVACENVWLNSNSRCEENGFGTNNAEQDALLQAMVEAAPSRILQRFNGVRIATDIIASSFFNRFTTKLRGDAYWNTFYCLKERHAAAVAKDADF